MFGEFIKTRRIGRGLTLRKFCALIEIDPSNWSKVERGLLPAPQDEERLRGIAFALGISEGSTGLMDRAKISAGAIPKDFLSDKEVLESLPMFFGTIRSEKPSPEELDMLIETIRRGK
jgi:transcriptional regulator with XRE-family HTH domain